MPKAPRKRPNFLLIFGGLFVLAVVIWHYHSSWVVSQLSVQTVKQGWVKHEKQVKAVFANTETVLAAPAQGTIILNQEDGRRFRKGETVARLVPFGVGQVPGEMSISAPISGLFYAELDGLEQVITPENLMNMELSGLLEQANVAATAAGDENSVVNKHSPIGKMVNNLYPSWAFIYLEDLDNPAKGDIVKLILEGEEHVGTVMKLSGQPKGAIVRFSQYIRGTTEKRVQNVTWSYKPPTKGTLVPAGALCIYGEERGVYIEDDGFIRFVNIKVIDYNNSEACVEGLPEGITVITNPRKGIEGLAIKI